MKECVECDVKIDDDDANTCTDCGVGPLCESCFGDHECEEEEEDEEEEEEEGKVDVNENQD